MKLLLSCCLILSAMFSTAQHLALKNRSLQALGGAAFAKSISDSTLTVDDREEIIYREIRSGNVPNFYRQLVAVSDTCTIKGRLYTVSYYVLPDYLAIGSDDDYFYCPMRPALAQRLADLFHMVLPTRKISDRIYEKANLKMIPAPIPPTKAMSTVPVFAKHNNLLQDQRKESRGPYPLGSLVAGNKKDIVISNKIYTTEGKSHVVIYGWHKPNGRAIQPLYNGHDANWVDYSHGVRLIQNKIRVEGKKTTMRKVLRSGELNGLLSDEGAIVKSYYPIKF